METCALEFPLLVNLGHKPLVNVDCQRSSLNLLANGDRLRPASEGHQLRPGSRLGRRRGRRIPGLELVPVLSLPQLVEPPVALSVGQHPRDPHARVQALLEPAVLAALPRLQVDLAVLALGAEEDLVVLALDSAPEEGSTAGTDATAVVAVLAGLLAADGTFAGAVVHHHGSIIVFVYRWTISVYTYYNADCFSK